MITVYTPNNKKQDNKKQNAKFYKILTYDGIAKIIAVECNKETLLKKWLEFTASGVTLNFVEFLCSKGIRACEIKLTALLNTIDETIIDLEGSDDIMDSET